METFTRWVYYFLESLGLDLSYMTNLNRLIVLVLIAVLAFLTDWICRKGIVRLVRKVTQKTKVTWDDLLFNDRVMNNFCHILPPVVVYILLPIAFPDGSDALAFIRKLCIGVYYSGCFAVYQHFSGSHIPVGHTERSIS